MTTADHIAALASRAQAAVASITPDPIQWATEHGAHVTIGINDTWLNLNVHGMHKSTEETYQLLREAFPNFEATRKIYDRTRWVESNFKIEGVTVQIAVFTEDQE